MSMNFSEFKKLLGAEPWNAEPETLAARQSDPVFEQAALEAEAFERKLQDALEINVPAGAQVENLLDISAHPARGHPRWLAIAASVLIMVGVAGTAWYQVNKPRTVEEYVASHYLHDGGKVLAMAAPGFDNREVNRILNRLSAVAGSELVDRVRFIKFCPTLHGRGAHMILESDAGPFTVIFMPETPVLDGESIIFGDSSAQVISLEIGSAAIIGAANVARPGIEAFLKSSITPISIDA